MVVSEFRNMLIRIWTVESIFLQDGVSICIKQKVDNSKWYPQESLGHRHVQTVWMNNTIT